MASRAEILAEYGIKDGSEVRVQTVQERGKLWLVGINAIGNPITTISPKKGQELALRLNQVGEIKLAHEISSAAQKAHKANGNE